MINRNILFDKINNGIIDERINAFRINLNKNIKYIERYGGLQRIIPLLKGKTVIVAGAGPSLEENLILLKKHFQRDDIALISTDMAFRPLMINGIRPEFVISCETTPVDFFNDTDTGNIHLLAFSCMSNFNIRSWRGDISFYNWMIDDREYQDLWERAGVELGSVATGSVVTSQAISLALGCGISSLVLVGNDLGFSDVYHIKESLSHKRSLLTINRCSTLTAVEMNYIRKIRNYEIKRGDIIYYTTAQFLAAKMWLEDLFKWQKMSIIDCSVPGLSEKCVKKSTLESIFSNNRKKSRRGKKRR